MIELTKNTHWTTDPAHSEISFVVRHAGISKVRGNFTRFSAQSTVDESGKVSNDSKAVVDLSSINTGNEDRDAHLRTSEFFDIERFPEATFTNISMRGYEFEGDLTIRGVTKRVTFKVLESANGVDQYGSKRIGVEAKTEILRSEFGLNWNSVLDTGGVLVSDKVTIELDLSFVQSTPEAE